MKEGIMPEEKRDLRVTLGVRGDRPLDLVETLFAGLFLGHSMNFRLHGGGRREELRGLTEIQAITRITDCAARWDVFLVIPCENPQATAIWISRTLGEQFVSSAIVIDPDDYDVFEDEQSFVIQSNDFERWAIKTVPDGPASMPFIQINVLHLDVRDVLLEILQNHADRSAGWVDDFAVGLGSLRLNVISIENNEDVPMTTLSLEVASGLPNSADEIGGCIKSSLASFEVAVMLGLPGFETKMLVVWSSGMISIAVHLPAEEMIPS